MTWKTELRISSRTGSKRAKWWKAQRDGEYSQEFQSVSQIFKSGQIGQNAENRKNKRKNVRKKQNSELGKQKH